jgi:hypothetical protein
MKQQLMLVAMLSVGTALTTMGSLKPVAASLTPPVTYAYSYTWNATDSEQYLNVNGVDSIPLYTRTADGAYYNYTSTFNVIDDLIVTQTFNRSNTTWQASGTFYKPDENKIGSTNGVGSVNDKVYISFDNQTNKNYYIYIDVSSVADAHYNFYRIDNKIVGGVFQTTELGFLFTSSRLNTLFIPSYSQVIINTTPGVSSQRYLDAWYLQDLGISEAYQQGLDAETDGILTDYLGTDAQQIGWVLIGIAAILFAFKGGK